MTDGDPHPHAVASDPVSGVLRDILARLDGWERLDTEAGVDDTDRAIRDRAHMFGRRVAMLRLLLKGGLPVYAALIAIAADAIRWAATLEHTGQ